MEKSFDTHKKSINFVSSFGHNHKTNHKKLKTMETKSKLNVNDWTWEEFVNPDYLAITLKSGRELRIFKKRIQGGKIAYQYCLQLFYEHPEKANQLVNQIIDRLDN